jgi:hypothetical protein
MKALGQLMEMKIQPGHFEKLGVVEGKKGEVTNE